MRVKNFVLDFCPELTIVNLMGMDFICFQKSVCVDSKGHEETIILNFVLLCKASTAASMEM